MRMPTKLKLKKKKQTFSAPLFFLSPLLRGRLRGGGVNRPTSPCPLLSKERGKKLRKIFFNAKFQISNIKSNLNNKFLKKKQFLFTPFNKGGLRGIFKNLKNSFWIPARPAGGPDLRCRSVRDDRTKNNFQFSIFNFQTIFNNKFLKKNLKNSFWIPLQFGGQAVCAGMTKKKGILNLLKIKSLSHSFKIENFKPARQSLQLRLMAGGLKIKWLQNRFVRVKQPVHKLIAIILLLALITSIFLNPSSQPSTSAATYYFTQNSWAGGASTTALALHPTDSTGWTRYQSASSTIIAGANSVTATTTSGSDWDTSTADFNGATSQTTVASDAVSLAQTSSATTLTHTADGDFSGGNFGSPAYTEVDTGQGRVRLNQPSGSENKVYTGAEQTWTVPAGITSINVDMAGASGSGSGGYGGRATTTLSVAPGSTLYIYVGGSGGYNGGGSGGGAYRGDAAGGGTDIRIGGTAFANRVVVAAGGAGGGLSGAAGGAGGGLDGAAGAAAGSFGGGGGGTQTAGGSGGTGSGVYAGVAGGLGYGGSDDYGGGSGGGGYYGGGSGGGSAGGGSGGGGGSSYASSTITTNTTHTPGYRSGDGYVNISYTPAAYNTPGYYTYYVDSSQSTPAWSSFNFLKNASGGVTTLKVQVMSKATNDSAPTFTDGGNCDSGLYTTNSTYTSGDISECAKNAGVSGRYLWYEVTFTASADTLNTPYLEQFQAATRVAYQSSGNYQSLITNTGQPNYSWGNLTYTKAGTGSIGIRARTCNDSACSGETAIDSCTLFSSSPANITSDTTCVHAGDQWIQYKAYFTGGDTINPLSLNDVTTNWNYYPSSQTLTSSPFDSSSGGNLIGALSWGESATSTNATTTISIRTASTSALLTSANWSDFTYSSSTCARVGATTTCPTTAIPASMKDVVNDRWFQYKVTLTSNGASTTILSQVKVTYVVNAPPDIQTAASQGTDGLVTIGYRIRDTDTASGTTAGTVYVTLEYCTAASSTDCTDTGTANWSTASAGAIVSGSLGTTSIPIDGSWQTSTSTVIWNPKVDYNAKYYNNTYKVRVKANDSEAANNLGYGVSNLFTLDTTNPVPAAVPLIVQATSSPARLNLNCVDSSTLYMRIGTTSALTGISYVAYAPTSTINIDSYNPATTTIYVQFKDQFNNTTTIQSAITPETPSAIMVQDTTNVLTNEFRLFLAWKVVALPTPGFGRYSLLKSASSTTGFTEISSTTDRNLNYFTDTAVNASTTYYYKLVTTDANNNASFYSATVNGLANGIQDAGEGGGGTDVTAPTLNSVSVSTTTTQSATIVWNTNEPSGSVVGYSTTSAAFTTETGVSSMRQDASILGQHTVTITNLVPSTTYYFQAKSADPTGNTGTDNNSGPGYTFTTRPGPRITTGPTTTYINNNRATIVWATDLNSNSEVVYSTSSQMTNAITFQGLADAVTAHSVLVTGLTQNTWYYYYVKSMDGSSNTAIDDNAGVYYSFRTNNDITPPTLSNIATSTGRTSAVITWNTDEDADSTIQYGTSTSYGLTSSNLATTTKIHALTLTNLLANTLYHFKINSIDSNANSATSSDYTFTTETFSLYNVSASSTGISSMDINWSTNENASSQVQYATSSSLSNSTLYPTNPTNSTQTHSVSLAGLTQKTTYYYRASSTAGGDTKQSPIYYFTTGDNSAPTITNATSTLVTDTSAVITWTTDENADSILSYGTATGVYTASTSDATLTTIHSLALTNLNATTTYYYRVISADGNSNQSTSTESSFKTPSFQITNVTVNNVSTTTVNITWNIDVAASAQVIYATSSNLSNSTTYPSTPAAANTSQSIALSGLSQNTTYYYKASSTAAGLNVTSPIYQFTTGDTTGPVISNVASSTGRTSAVITWTTDEDANSTVYYGTTTSYGLTATNSTSTKVHVITLTNLAQSTLYHFKINALDGNSNSATSSDYTFTTDTFNLYSITAQNVSTTSVNIIWNTLEAARSQVAYSINSDLSGATIYPSSPTATSTSHSITLSGLNQATTYYYRASSTFQNAVYTSPIYQFTTGDQTAPTISNVGTSSLAVSTAVITWNTNEVANSRIVYGTAAGVYTASTSDPTLTTVHALILTNLNATTTYYYRVVSVDGNSNSATSSENSFKTTSFQITNVLANNIATSTATINWSTDVLTSGQVLYSNDSSFTTPMIYPTLPAAAALSQSIQLFNLNQNTTYYYQASSTGFGLNLTSPLYQFLTGDTTSPVISNIASSTARTSASITWTTDEDANSQIDYGITTGYGSQASSTALTKTHVLNLTNLSPVTLYHFAITASDMNSNSTTTADYTFTTQTFSLTSVTASTTGITSMDINWTTNENANSQVEYATSSGLTSSILYPTNPTNSTQAHSVSLTGLAQKTTYYYRASSTAGGDTKQSPIYYFTTGDNSAPNISNATSTLVTDTSAVITWTTDENADSIMTYGTATGVYTASTSDATLTRNHSISLTSLTANTTYYYFLTSRDTNSNSTSTTEQTFTTRETLYTETEKEAAEETARTSNQTSGGGLQIIDKTDKTSPSISNVKVANVKSTEATVEWETDEVADSILKFGTNNNYGSLGGQYEMVTNHKVQIASLLPQNNYNYKILARDSSGNLSESAESSFTTLSLSEEIAKNLETPTSDQIKPEEQKINNESFLDLVTKTIDILKSFASHVSINTLQTGLNTQYNSLEDLARLVPSPIMSGEPKVEVGATTASISWTTDKEANSLVAIASVDKYKVNDPEPYAQVVGLPSDNTTVHKVIIYDLKPDTLYHYQLRSKAPIGPLAKSGDFTFTTKKESLSIDSYNIANISSSKAIFKWVTNSETDSNVKYIPYRGNTLAVTEAKSKYDKAVTTIHEITIDDLEAGIIYQIELSGKDAKNNSVQKVINPFSTEKDGYPPAINQVQTDMAISPGKDSRVQALISWVTDEPATSRVYYQKGFAEKEDISKMEKTQLDSAYTKKHIMVITKFESGSIYTFKVESTDSSGNTAISKTYTILAPKQTETIFEVILKNFESIFGWMKMM